MRDVGKSHLILGHEGPYVSTGIAVLFL